MTEDQIRELAELFHECAMALYVDPDNDVNIGGVGVRAHYAITVLDAVAEILGCQAPSAILEELERGESPR